MKSKFTYLFIFLFSVICTSSYAQTTKEAKKMYKNENKHNAVVDKQVHKKASKEARKDAKRLARQGYMVPVGKIPMEKQLERAWRMQYELTPDHTPKYLLGQANSVAGNQNAAKMQATNLAKLELVGQMESQLAQMIEMKVNNQEMTTEEAATVTSMVSSSKTLISGKLGQVIPVVEIYRQLPTGNFEVQITLGYDTDEALHLTKDAIRADLNKQSEGLGEKVDAIL